MPGLDETNETRFEFRDAAGNVYRVRTYGTIVCVSVQVTERDCAKDFSLDGIQWWSAIMLHTCSMHATTGAPVLVHGDGVLTDFHCALLTISQFVYVLKPTCCAGGWRMMFDSLARGTLFQVYKNNVLVAQAKGLYGMTTYWGSVQGCCSRMFCPVDKIATIYDGNDNELFYYSEFESDIATS